MVLKEYKEDDETTFPSSDEGIESDEAPDLITSREDFESMMDEFLDDYEILGRKMKARLAGDTGADKLDTMRRALGRDERILITASDDDNDLLMPLDVDSKKDRWDCETILCVSLRFLGYWALTKAISDLFKPGKPPPYNTCL